MPASPTADDTCLKDNQAALSASGDAIGKAASHAPGNVPGLCAKGASVKRRRALVGLDPNAILPPPRDSFVEGGDDQPARHAAAHITRSIRHGREPVNYDMKLHPMDKVIRPKYAAKRMSGGQSRCASRINAGEDEAVTTDETEPSNMGSTDDDIEDDAIADQDPEPDTIPFPLERVQDPSAILHSSRGAARKFVNYNEKHHPQDFGIPGYRKKRQAVVQVLQHPKPRKSAPKRQTFAPSEAQKDGSSRQDTVQITDDNYEESGDESDQEEDPSAGADRTPPRSRKALKTTSSGSPSATRARARSNKQGVGGAVRHKDPVDAVADEDIVGPASRLIAASQMPSGESPNMVSDGLDGGGANAGIDEVDEKDRNAEDEICPASDDVSAEVHATSAGDASEQQYVLSEMREASPGRPPERPQNPRRTERPPLSAEAAGQESRRMSSPIRETISNTEAGQHAIFDMDHEPPSQSPRARAGVDNANDIFGDVLASICSAPPSRQSSHSRVGESIVPLPTHFEEEIAIIESHANAASGNSAVGEGGICDGNEFQSTMLSTPSSGILSLPEQSQSATAVQRTSAVTTCSGAHHELASPAKTQRLAE